MSAMIPTLSPEQYAAQHTHLPLNEQTFDAPATGRVPVCVEHGPECIGHAIRVQSLNVVVDVLPETEHGTDR